MGTVRLEAMPSSMARNRNKLLTISLCLVILAAAAADEQFVYSGFTAANLTLDGAAVVTPSGLLELTNGTLRQKAHAMHPTTLCFRNVTSSGKQQARSFSSSFVFGILCHDPNACGHGVVFFVAPERYDLSGAFPSQYIGLVNGTTNGDVGDHLLGVELDTDQNNEFRDIDGNHVGVDIDSLMSVSSSSAGYYSGDHRGSGGEFRNLTLASGEAMQVWVEYDGEEKRIDVTMAPLKMAKPSKPLLSVAYDLSMVLTDVARVGFSSATGSFNSRHYVLGWSFAMDGPAPAIDISKLPKLPRFGPKHHARLTEIVPPVATAVLILGVGAIAILLVRRRLRYREVKEDWEVEFGPHRFAYKDLFKATDGFKNKNLLGIGGFGRVYKGVLPVSKMEIAVKKVSHDSKQGMKEFVAEVVSIGRLQHRNLVRLLGYCRRKGKLLLVYEYMSNGSLDRHLYGASDVPVLDWDQRFRIIKGIVSGLLYLHEEWEKVIIHRDIKTSNVLLDSDMDGRLGDFGLARLYNHGANPHTTHVVGTIGYLAPELGRTSKATPLTDMFAFGIFILEVTCGQRPIMKNSNGDQLMLVDWVVEHWHNGSLTDTVDARLHGRYNIGEASQIIMAHIEIISFLVVTVIVLFHSLNPDASVSATADQDQFVFTGFAGANLTLDGTATGTASGLLELTNGSVHLKGYAFLPAPVHFRSSLHSTVRSFSVSFVFAILTTYPGLSCHGIAFAVVPGTDLSSALGAQYMGLANIDNNGNTTNSFFAAEIDTMQNVEFQDMNNNHVGIDINGLHSIEAHAAGYYDDMNGSFHDMNLISGEVMQAWVDYDGEAARINVTIAPVGVTTRPVRPLVSTIYNLSNVLKEPSYIGFTSATGPINSRHYILGWSFAIEGLAPAIDITKLPKLPRLGPKPRSKVLEILLPIATAALIVILGTLVVVLVRRRMRYAEVREDWEVDFGPHRFSYKDLFHATDGFNDKHLLGRGGFGKVYRGVLPKSKVDVAVKRVSHESRQGMKEFVAEVVSIGRIRHRNLVQLLGYCRRKGELLLVYDYMSNGSLDKYLHYKGARPTLDWAKRIQVIRGVASGLLYLHEKWEKLVIHRDIKASNVLLDKEMNGRLGDFGLARWVTYPTLAPMAPIPKPLI
nr:unnamed protein product [Digitaria exilis]